MTKKEYIPKQFSTPKPIKKNKIVTKIEKNTNTPEIKQIETHNLFFIKVLESESIISVSDQLKSIKDVGGYVIAIEKSKISDMYQLIIGPITNYKEAQDLQQILINKGYISTVILER